MNNSETIKQMGVQKIILYHLLPGIPVLLLTVFFAHPTWGLGMSSVLAFMFSIMIGIVPVQLLIVFLSAKRQGVSFKDAISFTEKTPAIKFLLWAVPCFLLGGLLFAAFANIEHSLWANFSLMPDWLRLDKFMVSDYSVDILRVTAVLFLICNVVLCPITEELYFRGFLLPRMAKLGKAAPLVNAALFSLYHFFSPWEIITRIVGLLPLVYTVWYKKNIRIGMAVHCSLNFIGSIGMLVAIFKM